jgi:hypothetical protein
MCQASVSSQVSDPAARGTELVLSDNSLPDEQGSSRRITTDTSLSLRRVSAI